MLFYFLLAVLIVVIYVYINNRSKTHYGTKHNIPYYGGVLGLGFAWDYLTGTRSMFELVNELYKKYPEAPALVTGNGLKIAIVLKNPDDIQHVLQGDFNNFNHRGIDVNSDVDQLADNVLFMNGMRWKLMRQKLTPIFTSAKLRNMYYIMNKSAQDFIVYLKDENNLKKENTFNTLSTFCAAAITASIFGVGHNTTMESPFLEMARKAFEPTFISNLKFALASVTPKLFQLFKIQLFQEFEDFFIGSMKHILKLRKESKVKTHDFADLCIGIQKSGTLKDPTTGLELKPTDELMSAQAFFFYTAGVEPSATSMFFTLYELAKHPEILEKVQKEVDDIFYQTNGQISHDDIMKMEYLDRVIDEAMRMHPAVGLIGRKCTHESTLPVAQINVEKGVALQIPVYAIHQDPKYYPNPEVFDPDRFTDEEIQKRPHFTYMPFGDGNRMCIGKFNIISFLILISTLAYSSICNYEGMYDNGFNT